MMGLFDLDNLEVAVQELFGAQAKVLYAGQGRVVLSPGRDLSPTELVLLQLYPRVLPVALGVDVRFHFGDVRVFGFGEGWGGLCEETVVVDDRSGKTFGFNCEGSNFFGGFCEDWITEGAQIAVNDHDTLVTEDGDDLVTSPLTEDAHWACREGAPWMCEIDVQPYSC